MKRRIIHIDEGKCTGCGLCVNACQEGALALVDGKAKLMRDDYCDGLGNCLPNCPVNAISFIEREAAAFDEAAVLSAQREKLRTQAAAHGFTGCPGSRVKAIAHTADAAEPAPAAKQQSRLSQWPVQIKLVPVNAAFFKGAKLLIAADCTAYAYAGFHEDFIRGRVTLIGCPKLDGVNYTDKLTDIIASNDIREVLIVRMEVPCCGGLELAAKNALKASGKFIPWNVVTIASDGRIVD